MVNLGVSRACAACKKKRKKCDEKRPSCTRCIKGKHTCPGYEDETDVIFRHWPSPVTISPSPPADRWWNETSMENEALEAAALDIFLHDFVVRASDRHVSRGFLDGLPSLLRRLGPDSTLAKATKLVALASVANKLRRETLLATTRRTYCRLIQDFNQSLSLERDQVSLESLYTAVLLGLYEIVSDTGNCSAHDTTHIHGVFAILESGISHLDLASDVHVFELGIPLLLKLSQSESQIDGLLRASGKSDCGPALDTTMIKMWHFLTRVEPIMESQTGDTSTEKLQQLYHEAELLEKAFAHWSDAQGSHRASPVPKTVGYVEEKMANASEIAYSHAGAVDMYLDNYVATVWNTYRKSHLYLLDIMTRIAQRLKVHDHDILVLRKKITHILPRFIASIPYLLCQSVDEYLHIIQTASSQTPMPNHPVGGLLLLHPLYCVAINPVISLSARRYCARCLDWIGREMGIGQASFLARWSLEFGDEREDTPRPDPRLPRQALSESHNLIWAGMLLQSA